jgi:hypothetical protein
MTERRFPSRDRTELPTVPEPDQHRLKRDMAAVIAKAIKRQGLTKDAAAERLGISVYPILPTF